MIVPARMTANGTFSDIRLKRLHLVSLKCVMSPSGAIDMAQTWGNRNRLRSITAFWVIVIDWIDKKWNVIVIDYIASLIVIDNYFRD